jgi:hypothetical protein
MGLRHVQRGHLSGLAVDHAVTVTATACVLDHAVIEMGRTEEWRKLRVCGVSLDRYWSDGGLDPARGEIRTNDRRTTPVCTALDQERGAGRTLPQRNKNNCSVDAVGDISKQERR